MAYRRRTEGTIISSYEPRPEYPDFMNRIDDLLNFVEQIDPVDEPARSAFPNRNHSTQQKLTRELGGNSDSERAMALGLAWLARQQKQDGGWEFDAGDKDDRTAATGLALLPFLGVGETHRSRNGNDASKYWKTVERGLMYLTKRCPPNGPNAGKFGGATTMTSQALATLALVEAYDMTHDPALKPFAQAALDYIQRKQLRDGGWSDTADGEGDIEVSGWQLQALFAARMTRELVVDDRVIENALEFLDYVSAGPRKALYGTTSNADAKPGTTPTAIGLWCRYHFDSWGPTHPGMIEGVSGLLKNPPGEKNRDPLYLYYGTWVVARYEGEDWKEWNAGPKQANGTHKGGVRDLLVFSQTRKDDRTKIGSWAADGEWGRWCGRLGTTALNVLTLEVYYRYLPLYKRSSSDGAIKIIEDIK